MWQLGVLEGHEVVTVSFGGWSIVKGGPPLGIRVPATGAPSATAILAFSPAHIQQRFLAECQAIDPAFDADHFRAELSGTTRRGYAFRDKVEWRPPFAVIAAPVFDAYRRPIASIAALTPETRQTAAALARQLAPKLLELAAAVSEHFSYDPQNSATPPGGEQA